MTPFTCPNCKNDTWKLIATEDKGGTLRCPACYKVDSLRPTYLHQLAEGNKGDKSFTVAKDMMIDRRVLSPDKKTSIDRVTGRESQY